MARTRAAPMTTHPCLVCKRPTRQDGYCRTRRCPNQVPDDLIRPARETALAQMRETLAIARQNRTDTSDD